MQPAGADPDERHPQPVQRVLKPSGPLRRNRPALETVFQHVTCANGPAAGGVRLGLGLGRHPRRRRLSEGQPRRRIVAVEALECPTMLYNGFGDHNIQGIGDKHVPLIHNVTNTDLVVGI